jgi:hypothetical protein
MYSSPRLTYPYRAGLYFVLARGRTCTVSFYNASDCVPKAPAADPSAIAITPVIINAWQRAPRVCVDSLMTDFYSTFKNNARGPARAPVQAPANPISPKSY